MKKNNEGYVLAMVMVVIAVLAVVASTMLSVGLRNVQTQQIAVDRMQAKYEAEGEIQKVIAELALLKQEINAESKEQAQNDFELSIVNCLNGFNNDTNGSSDKIKINDINWLVRDSRRVCKFTIETENRYEIVSKDEPIVENIKIITTLELKYVVEPATDSGPYEASIDAIENVSYEATTKHE